MTEILEWSWVNIVEAGSSRAPPSTQNYKKPRPNLSTPPDVGQVERLVPDFNSISDASVLANVSNLADLYEERVAIREFDGHYSRAEAESLAWGEVLNRWHMRHGERVPRDLCAGCRRPIGSAKALDMIDGNRVHLGDPDCLVRHGERWRADAMRALLALGLRSPGQ
jgi:hypothetical protein